jgi:CubicO group peptidase (beta-lactamase class C family)
VTGRVSRSTVFVLALYALGVSAQNIAPAPEYVSLVQQLGPRIEQQIADKKLPALSIALVDDQRIVWAEGFGFEDAAKKSGRFQSCLRIWR